MAISSPLTLGSGATIKWSVPSVIAKRGDIDFVKIWRSQNENRDYVVIDEIPYTTTNGVFSPNTNPATAAACYNDAAGSSALFYLVTFVSTISVYESPWHITYFPPTPSEARLIEQIRRATPQVIQDMMTDEDYLNGLVLAVQIFNTYPPETTFTLSSFPRSHTAFLIGLAQLTALTSRYLPLSIRDWSYSEPGGVVMAIDRGAKINQAMDIIAKVYTQYLPLVKLDFSWDSPMGIGTISLPLSMGGSVSRGLLNVLDIFTATGR